MKGNPAAPGGDPGWRAQVITPKRNDACLYCNAYTACAEEYRSFEMTGEVDYYNRLLQKVSVAGGSNGFLKDVAFTGSAEFEFQRQDVFGASLTNIQAEGSCQLWEGLRVPGCPSVVFDSNFLLYMDDFPTSTDQPGWFNKVLTVFQLFGTHIIGDDISLGARWTDESQMTEASYEGLRAANVNISAAAEVSAEFFRTKEASGQYESEEETELRVAFDGATSHHRAIYLGDPPPSDLNYYIWANNIKTPIPISFTVSPISELLVPKLFLKIQILN